jgi:hypothetical protein
MGLALLAAIVAPNRFVPYVSLLALGFLAVFVFRGDIAWPWWWLHVLRRRLPTPGSTFNYHLAVEVRAWAEAIRAASERRDNSDLGAGEALTRLRNLEAPDRDWSALRDDYAGLGERWLLLLREGGQAEDGRALEAGLRDLEARRRELATRT